jgi:hypothetical protein
MSSLSDFSQGVLTAVIIVYIFIFMYAFWNDTQKEKELRLSNEIAEIEETEERYHKFAAELSGDMKKYQIGQIDQKSIETVVNKILEKHTKEKSLFRRLINSGKTGFLVGGLSGGITSGPSGALAAGVVFGLVNPIVIIINEFLYMPEELPASKESKDRSKKIVKNNKSIMNM